MNAADTRSQIDDIDAENVRLAVELSCQCIKGKSTPDSLIEIFQYLLEKAGKRLIAWENRPIRAIEKMDRKAGEDSGFAYLLLTMSYATGIDSISSIVDLQIGLEQRQPWALGTMRKFLKALMHEPLYYLSTREEYTVRRIWFSERLLSDLMCFKP